MKESTKQFIDGLCVGGTSFYLLTVLAERTGWNIILGTIAAIGISYTILMCSLMAESERRHRRKQHDAGTHDYYGNKIEEDEK